MRQLSALAESSPTQQLPQADRETLSLMREEEKLAHDVYVTLHESWDLLPLANIPWAESRHMEAVRLLLDRYGVADPVSDMTVGVFQDQELQELYNRLIAQGRQSIDEAIKVGAFIEERNIADLRRRLAETENEDLRSVYANLLRGSRNHLRAFARQLGRHDTAYEAKHLSQEEFDRIAASDHERGWMMGSANPSSSASSMPDDRP